jgi:ABC-type multidrug transport system fused ATPase/permease subunit
VPTNEVELTQANKENSKKDVSDSLERGELSNENKSSEGKKEEKKLTLYELFTILSPYFWPSSASENAFMNRVRSSSTWAMVAISKACNIIAPFYLSTATNSLVRGQWGAVVKYCTLYIFLRITSSVCKEMQGVLYIRVKQQATIELQEFIFTHIHHLSLAFHLNKSTGVIMKAMDRGVDAANTLISYLFLFLIPALIECFAVIILFFLSYKQYLLSLIIVIAIVIYAAVTIFLTNYRKKFREETNKHDNDYHNQATDSILNYETVKYFTNEGYEVDKYKQLISKYQKAHSSTQFFLSTLNISQQVLFMFLLIMLVCTAM